MRRTTEILRSLKCQTSSFPIPREVREEKGLGREDVSRIRLDLTVFLLHFQLMRLYFKRVYNYSQDCSLEPYI